MPTVKEIFEQMPAAFNKDAAAGMNAVFQYDISGDDGGKWFQEIKDGELAISEGEHDSPNITISMADQDYIDMIGGKFLTHPSKWPALTINVLNRHHPVCEGIEDFAIEEELYLMETYGHFELLMSTWYKGFERPMTWVKPYGHGRVFYTALGHGQPQSENPNFQRLIVNAAKWAKNPG